jgi:hypothetical protein
MSLATSGSKRNRIRQWLSSRGSTPASGPNLPAPSTTSTSQSNALGTTTATLPNFLDRVFLHLSPQDQDTIRLYTVTNTTVVDSLVQQALAATRQQQATCEAKRWTFTFGGHTVVLRDLDKIVKWLDRFKQVGDVASNADPVHAGLPWAGIRLLLEVSIADLVNVMPAWRNNCHTDCAPGSDLRTKPDGGSPPRPRNRLLPFEPTTSLHDVLDHPSGQSGS